MDLASARGIQCVFFSEDADGPLMRFACVCVCYSGVCRWVYGGKVQFLCFGLKSEHQVSHPNRGYTVHVPVYIGSLFVMMSRFGNH